MRDDPIEFDLPTILPLLNSTTFFFERCGPITYNITVEPFPHYFDVTKPADGTDGQKGINIKVNQDTSSEEDVKDFGPTFARDWGS